MITLHWHTEPGLILLILVSGWLYTLVVGPLRKRVAPGEPFPTGRWLTFMSGLVVGYLAVGSPLDQIGEEFLFAAHMVQHELLIYVVPILLLQGLPHWAVDLPLRNRAVRKGVRFLVHPVTSGLSFTAIFTVWHIPWLYEAALHSKPVHILEHWTIFVPGLMVMWAFFSPSRLAPPLSYGGRMIFIFLLMIGQLPVFGFLTFSGNVFYPTYEMAPRLEFWELTPIQDQTAGGVIMKLCNMAISLFIFAQAFYLWSRDSEHAGRPEAQVAG